MSVAQAGKKWLLSGLSDFYLSGLSDLYLSGLSEFDLSGLSKFNLSGLSGFDLRGLSEFDLSGQSDSYLRVLSELLKYTKWFASEPDNSFTLFWVFLFLLVVSSVKA